MRWCLTQLVVVLVVVSAMAGGGSPAWGWPLASPAPPVVLTAYRAPAQRWLAGHRGVDLAAVPGQDVLAPSAGVITFAGTVAGTPVVVVSASSGLRSTLEPVVAEVAPGSTVRRGQVVGVIATGSSPEPSCGGVTCLHWGVLSGRGHGAHYRDPLALPHPRAPVLLPWVSPASAQR